MQLDAYVEEVRACVLEDRDVTRLDVSLGHQCGDAARRAERPPGPGQRLEIAQAARTLLEVGLEHFGDGSGTDLSLARRVGEPLEEPCPAARREVAGSLRKVGNERFIAGNEAGLQKRRQHFVVVVGERDCIAPIASDVSDHHAGVPQRVEELLGGAGDLAG